MRADGSGVRRLTGDPALDDVFPRWTADGRSVVFGTFSGPDGTPSADVWIVGRDGGGRRQVVATAAEEFFPDPRPGGRWRG